MKDHFISVASPQVGEEEITAVAEVLASGSYVSGRKVEEFEKRFADFIGTEYAIGVNSGTAALHIALEAAGVGRGDEVIVPPVTFFATISSVLYLGAVPVFADIDPDDLCLSPGDIERRITSRTKAILPVHLFGAAAKMNEMMFISKKYQIPIIEDCAQAHGTEYDGQKVGSFGKAGCFSFFATKHMTTGEGGMITSDDPELAETSRIIRNHGMRGRDIHDRLGFNNRMTELEAAIGLIQLNKLNEMNRRRIDNSEYILGRIKGIPWVHIPLPKTSVKHTFFWCPVMIKPSSGKTMDQLKAHLKENRIGFRERYSEPVYRQPVLRRVGLDFSGLHLPNAEKVAGNVIGLPNHPGLTRDDLDRVIDILRLF